MCAALCGTLFFVLFLTLMVVPEQDKIDRTIVESCRVTALDVHEYDCADESQCSCSSAGCGANPTCSSRHSTPFSEGLCCDGTCCVRTCCQGCSKSRRSCSGSGDSRSCSTSSYYDSCCTRSCCEHSTEQCRVDWDSCWAFKITFIRLAAPQKVYPPADAACGFADRSCEARERKRWAVWSMENSTAAGGTGGIECWYDPKHDAVAFSKPAVDKLTGGWVGAGFGISFLVIAALLALCTLACTIRMWGCKAVAALTKGCGKGGESRRSSKIQLTSTGGDTAATRSSPLATGRVGMMTTTTNDTFHHTFHQDEKAVVAPVAAATPWPTAVVQEEAGLVANATSVVVVAADFDPRTVTGGQVVYPMVVPFDAAEPDYVFATATVLP